MQGLQAVVLAGGLATRMRPRTLTVPKAMLEVAGRPFVEWQLERLAACGLTDVVMCVAHLAEQIEAHVGDGARFGVNVRWSHEGPTLLGTAGAIRAALDLLAPTFLVTYGDSYLPFDYAEPLRILHAHADCDGVMSVYPNKGQWDASNVVMDATGEWVARYEKGRKEPEFDHIDYGATALRREVIAALPDPVGAGAGAGAPTDKPGGVGAPTNKPGGVGLDALQHAMAGQKRLRACIARERFFEIGSPEGLADLDRHLRSTGHAKVSP